MHTSTYYLCSTHICISWITWVGLFRLDLIYGMRLTYDYDQKYTEFIVSKLVPGSRAQVMGHSTTTCTTFYLILTTYQSCRRSLWTPPNIEYLQRKEHIHFPGLSQWPPSACLHVESDYHRSRCNGFLRGRWGQPFPRLNGPGTVIQNLELYSEIAHWSGMLDTVQQIIQPRPTHTKSGVLVNH